MPMVVWTVGYFAFTAAMALSDSTEKFMPSTDSEPMGKQLTSMKTRSGVTPYFSRARSRICDARSSFSSHVAPGPFGPVQRPT